MDGISTRHGVAHDEQMLSRYLVTDLNDAVQVGGSKGKGTTCSFIYEILKASGKQVHLVGNIGKPAINEIQNQFSPVTMREVSDPQPAVAGNAL